MSWSLLEMIFVTSCHFSKSLCLSSCSFLNYSDVLSNYIWAVWVTVISLSNSCCFRFTSIVNFSIWRFNSRIFASSSLWYFWSVTLSYSFCFPVMAHCSNSSWFQFSYNLICYTFSFVLTILPWISLSLSSFSRMTLLNFFTSLSSLPHCLSVTCHRWFSVSVSLFLLSIKLFVWTSSISTFLRCS